MPGLQGYLCTMFRKNYSASSRPHQKPNKAGQAWLKVSLLVVAVCLGFAQTLEAQCSICTKTASQLGEGPAAALNSAILYLAAAPLAIMGFIGWRWWKNEKSIRG